MYQTCTPIYHKKKENLKENSFQFDGEDYLQKMQPSWEQKRQCLANVFIAEIEN